MRRRALLALSLLAFATMGVSSPSTWTAAPRDSTIDLEVQAFGGVRTGRFEVWRGDIVFDPTVPAQTRATVIVQAASLKMRPAVATRRATGPEFLDAVRYPTIRFELRSLEPEGDDRFTAHADITMKGRTRAVRFPVDLRVEPTRVQMAGTFALDRSDFDIGTSGLMNRMVGRQVMIRIGLQMRQS